MLRCYVTSERILGFGVFDDLSFDSGCVVVGLLRFVVITLIGVNEVWGLSLSVGRFSCGLV